jgi:crotonobetainyl-CoA:carnitine CoA-transferase CaiB-like acyl-CoA transferase
MNRMPAIAGSSALSRFRILDLSRVRAGPSCVRQFADFGADIIKIESPPGVDANENMGGPRHGPDMQNLHRNKRAMTLNLKLPEAKEVFMRLVKTADVVVENFRPDVKFRLGIDYESLAKVNPRIILATTSTFGSEGPYATRVGFDTIGQAMSGAMHLSGDGQVPTRSTAPFVDFGTALLNTVGVLAALMDRAKSGKGQKVEAALLRTAINITNSHLIEQAALNLNRIATLNRGFTAGPSDSYKCNDGWIYAMTIGQPLFVRWCRLMGNEDLTADPRFKDDLARGDNGEALSAIMQKWCDARTVKEALAELEANRIPGGPVYAPQQTLDDPHVTAAKFFHEMAYPGMAKPAPVLQEPVKLSRTPLTIRRRAPKLGEHTDQILKELGYEAAAIEKLRADRVV